MKYSSTHWQNLSDEQIEEVMMLTEKETHTGLTKLEQATLNAYRELHGA